VGIIDSPPIRGTELVTNASGQATFIWNEGIGEYGTTVAYAFIDANNNGLEDAGEVKSTTISITIYEEEPPVNPVLTITSPAGVGNYDSDEDTITVGWSSDLDLDAGQFGIWARSAAGTWYIGQLVATNAGDDLLTYSATVPLTGVPAGWYQIIVGYRPTVGSGAWVSYATSYGFVFSVDAAPTPTVTITVPTGQGGYAAGDVFTATWTSDPSLTTGQFAVWVRSPGNTWYWMDPVVPATGAASYSAPVDLTGVADGLGYQVIVAYEPIANTGAWMSWATSPGVFSVGGPPPSITVTQPSGIGSYNDTQSVIANWTTNQTLAGGEFGVWVRTATGTGWYVTTLVAAAGAVGTVYSATLPLATVPDGLGNEVIVAYRPVAGAGAFMSWATSPGNFSVNSVPPTLTITAPTGSSTYDYGDTLTVSWNDPTANGEYGVWLTNGTTWYYSQLVAANGATLDSANMTLTVQDGTYQAVIAYRQNVGVGPWVAWATSPGTVTVID